MGPLITCRLKGFIGHGSDVLDKSFLKAFLHVFLLIKQHSQFMLLIVVQVLWYFVLTSRPQLQWALPKAVG